MSLLRRSLLLCFVFAFASTLLTGDAWARRSRRNGAAAAAQRKKVIANLQNQVSQAKQLLASAESKSGMSQAQIGSAASQLMQASSAMTDAKNDELEARTELREIEEDILEEQKEGSDFAAAHQALDAALAKLDDEFYRVTEAERPAAGATRNRATEHLRLDDDQRRWLKNDVAYQAAKEAVQDAVEHCDEVKQKLFYADAEWKAAVQHVHSAADDLRNAQGHGKDAGHDTFVAKKDYKNSQEVASATRSFIASAEQRLKSLGAKPAAANKTASKSNTKSSM
ncbi:MAG: hypothetical protein QM811_04585 [Pirellulales bacterium]